MVETISTMIQKQRRLAQTRRQIEGIIKALENSDQENIDIEGVLYPKQKAIGVLKKMLKGLPLSPVNKRNTLTPNYYDRRSEVDTEYITIMKNLNKPEPQKVVELAKPKKANKKNPFGVNIDLSRSSVKELDI